MINRRELLKASVYGGLYTIFRDKEIQPAKVEWHLDNFYPSKIGLGQDCWKCDTKEFGTILGMEWKDTSDMVYCVERAKQYPDWLKIDVYFDLNNHMFNIVSTLQNDMIRV